MAVRDSRDRRVLASIAKKAVRPATRRFFFWTDKHIEAAVTPLYQQAGRADERLHELQERTSRIEALEQSVEALQRVLPQVLESLSLQNAWAREARRDERALADKVRTLEKGLEALEETLGAADLGGLHEKLETRADELTELQRWVGALDADEVRPLQDDVAKAVDRVARLESRLEFVRREPAYEFRYGRRQDVEPEEREPQILNQAKVEAQGGELRLNLGCGHLPLEGYVNVDQRELDGVDVVADLRGLPFEKASVAEIFSSHVLEHFPVEELSRQLLPYLKSMLKPGGKFAAVVPDAEWMIREYSAGRFTFDDLRLVTFGDQEYEGDFHFTMFNEDEARRLLEGAGFIDVEFPVRGRRNGVCYEMEIVATKPPALAAPS